MSAPDPIHKPWAPWTGRTSAVVWFVVLVTLARLAYMIWLSPYTLAEDEAHYWEWSRHLDWSYYSKGPGVAWVIALSTGIFGNVEWAVRLPATVAAAIGSLAAADAAWRLSDDRRVGFVAAVLYQCVPPFAALSMLMTIDGPFLACWAVTCAGAVRAVTGGGRRWLIATGLALAAGFVFKYTIILLAAGLVVAFIIERRRLRAEPLVWMASAAAFALGLLPVLIWNANHDWVTVRHLLGHVGMPGGDVLATQGSGHWNYSPMWTLTYLGLLLIAGPPVVLGPIVAIQRWKSSPGVRVLAWASLPVLVFYLLVSLAAPTEGNWPLGGIVGLVPLCAIVIPQAIERRYIPIRACWRVSVGAGIVTTAGFVALPALAKLPRLERLLPEQRVMGMRQLAASATARLEALQASEGATPFLLTEHYGRASQLAFYMPGHPVVYCAGSFVPGARKSQYDLWQQTDLRNSAVIEALRGRPALIFGGRVEMWERSFSEVTDIGPLPGEPKANRTTFTGTSFRGFEDEERQP